MNKITTQSETPVPEPLPPLPLSPTPEDERIPVPPGDAVPEPIQLPPEESNKSPIDEGKGKQKAYLLGTVRRCDSSYFLVNSPKI